MAVRKRTMWQNQIKTSEQPENMLILTGSKYIELIFGVNIRVLSYRNAISPSTSLYKVPPLFLPFLL